MSPIYTSLVRLLEANSHDGRHPESPTRLFENYFNFQRMGNWTRESLVGLNSRQCYAKCPKYHSARSKLPEAGLKSGNKHRYHSVSWHGAAVSSKVAQLFFQNQMPKQQCKESRAAEHNAHGGDNDKMPAETSSPTSGTLPFPSKPSVSMNCYQPSCR